jgi:hypothetical protein
MKVKRNQWGRYQIEFTSNLNFDDGYKNHSLGTHKSTMEIWETEGGVPQMIEWDIPDLEETEHIGLEIDGKLVTGYDGVFELPTEAIEMLEALGYDCSEVKE